MANLGVRRPDWRGSEARLAGFKMAEPSNPRSNASASRIIISLEKEISRPTDERNSAILLDRDDNPGYSVRREPVFRRTNRFLKVDIRDVYARKLDLRTK